MIYKSFQGMQLSALGLGAMRLPVIGGALHNIDEAATAEMVDYAMANGINYYDTAWGYHEGHSESVMGKLLSAYPRESFYIATKFPGYDRSTFSNVEGIFLEQLKKCRVNYFDFYLFHNVNEANIDAYLDEKYGVFRYLMQQKQAGRIRHLGFSVHGSYKVMKRFLEAYGPHMEFCQIQLNYLDWSLQGAEAKMNLLREYDIPVWSMEPLRGGKLASLPAEAAERLQALRPGESACGWAFRFLQSLDAVTMVLSGMSNLQQVKENIQTFSTDAPLNTQEFNTLLEIAAGMTNALPCTACRYCTEYCPQKLDIPTLLTLYNDFRFNKESFVVFTALKNTQEQQRPGACIGCKSCEAVCPQQINISAAMADFAGKVSF